MKKINFIFLSVVLCLFSVSLFGCNDKDAGLNFYAPDGAPALAVSKFIYDKEDFGSKENINYQIVSSDKLALKMQSGEGDFIIMPVNLASKLYKANKTENYKAVGVVTHGNLYIVSKEEITLNDLKNKVMGVIGFGLVPDLTIKTILNNNGILYEQSDTVKTGKVAMRYFNSASELLPLLKQGKIEYALLGEPAVSKLSKQVATDYSYKLDVQKLYNENNYPQAVLMVKESVLTKYPDIAGNIKTAFTDGVSWLNENYGTAVDSVNLSLEEGLVPSLNKQIIDSKVIENCKIYWEDGENMKSSVQNYLQNIREVSSNSANAVGDEFFN